MTHRTNRHAVVLLITLALVLAACGAGSGPVTATSRRGTALLAEATRFGAASSAVSFEVRAGGAGGSNEKYARRGEDSSFASEYGNGGRNEVRRVDGVFYARSDLRLATGEPAPWVRVDPGPDQNTWLALLGDALVAPTPREASALLTSNVGRVTGLERGAAGARRLTVEPREVPNGERPAAIVVRPSEPAISGRRAGLYSRGRKYATRTYLGARWGNRAKAITVPEGTVSVEVVRDPQGAALPSEVLRAPAALPAGWSLRSVIGITPAQGDGTCQSVLTLYAATGRQLSAGYLAVYLKPSGCQTPAAPGSAKFIAGSNTGWVGREGAFTIGALTVEGVSVRFRSTLSPADLETVLATWKPIS